MVLVSYIFDFTRWCVVKWYEGKKFKKDGKVQIVPKKVVDVVPEVWLDKKANSLFYPNKNLKQRYASCEEPQPGPNGDYPDWDRFSYSAILLTSDSEEDCLNHIASSSSNDTDADGGNMKKGKRKG